MNGSMMQQPLLISTLLVHAERHHGFGDQFGSIGTDDMDAQNTVGLRTGQHLDEA